jgi:hypothetical protein
MRGLDAFDEISIPAPLAARDDLSRFPAYAFGIGDDAQSISDLPTAGADTVRGRYAEAMRRTAITRVHKVQMN